MKPAADEQNPRHWEKRVLAAYYRLLGSSQKAAGAAVGRSERSVWTWEQDTALTAQLMVKYGFLTSVVDPKTFVLPSPKLSTQRK